MLKDAMKIRFSEGFCSELRSCVKNVFTNISYQENTFLKLQFIIRLQQ